MLNAVSRVALKKKVAPAMKLIPPLNINRDNIAHLKRARQEKNLNPVLFCPQLLHIGHTTARKRIIEYVYRLLLKSSTIIPRQKRIARDLNISLTVVNQTLGELDGVLFTMYHRFNNGQLTNLYKVNDFFRKTETLKYLAKHFTFIQRLPAIWFCVSLLFSTSNPQVYSDREKLYYRQLNQQCSLGFLFNPVLKHPEVDKHPTKSNGSHTTKNIGAIIGGLFRSVHKPEVIERKKVIPNSPKKGYEPIKSAYMPNLYAEAKKMEEVLHNPEFSRGAKSFWTPQRYNPFFAKLSGIEQRRLLGEVHGGCDCDRSFLSKPDDVTATRMQPVAKIVSLPYID
jgi:hypothetical protein